MPNIIILTLHAPKFFWSKYNPLRTIRWTFERKKGSKKDSFGESHFALSTQIKRTKFNKTL